MCSCTAELHQSASSSSPRGALVYYEAGEPPRGLLGKPGADQLLGAQRADPVWCWFTQISRLTVVFEQHSVWFTHSENTLDTQSSPWCIVGNVGSSVNEGLWECSYCESSSQDVSAPPAAASSWHSVISSDFSVQSGLMTHPGQPGSDCDSLTVQTDCQTDTHTHTHVYKVLIKGSKSYIIKNVWCLMVTSHFALFLFLSPGTERSWTSNIHQLIKTDYESNIVL